MIKEVYRTRHYSKYLGNYFYTYRAYYDSGIDRYYNSQNTKTPQTIFNFMVKAKLEVVNAKVTRFYIE